MNKNIQKKIARSDIISFIESLPENYPVQLKSDTCIQLKPSQIIENIENKTKIGKSYYIQIGKYLQSKREVKKEINKNLTTII
jgi:hypothetical protein